MGRSARVLQTTFTSGELDPKLRARMDVTHYYNGADKLRNVLVFPQGGITRRPGSRFMAEILHQIAAVSTGGATITAPEGGTASNATDDDPATEVVTGAASTTNPFVILHIDFTTPTAIQFFDVIGLVLRDTASSGLNAPAVDVKMQYSINDIAWNDFGPAFVGVPLTDIQRRRSGTFGAGITARYWRIVRVGATDLGTYGFALDEIDFWSETATLSEVRAPAFRFSAAQRYTFEVTDRNVRVLKDGDFQADVFIPFPSSDLPALTWFQSLDTLIFFHEDHQPHRVQRQGADNEWDDLAVVFKNIPKHEYAVNNVQPAGTLTPSSIENLSDLTRSSGTWSDPGDIGTYITGNSGRARITEIVTSTKARASVIVPFFNTSAISSGDWTHEQGWEPVISAARGWPKCGTIWERGLWMGGLKSVPNAFLRSTLDDPFDLDLARALRDDGIFGQIDHPKEVAEIFFINNGRHLQFFTSAAEYFTLPNDESGVGPDNIAVKLTSDIGIKGPGLAVINVEGAALFIQRTGSAVREFVFTDLEQAYDANNIALLSPHLIEDPIDFAFRKAASTDEGNLIFVVNGLATKNSKGLEGSLAVLQTLRKQEIAAWMLWETDGKVRSVGIDETDVYVWVERTINGAQVIYRERLEESYFLDSAVQYTTISGPTTLPATTLAGLDHLEAHLVSVRQDGAVEASKTVSSGSITLDDQADDTAEIGLAFPDVKQNEVTRRLAAGDTPSSVYQDIYDGPAVNNGEGDGVWVRDMPVTFETPTGNPAGKKKRVSEVTLLLRETAGLFLGANGRPPRDVVFRRLGDELLDQPLPQISDDVVIRGLKGYSKFGQVEVVQRFPVSMTVLGIAKKVNI